MNKYAIYTDGLTYPVLEKDGQYYIGVPGTGHFSGQWKFLGVRERLKNSRTIIKPEDALKITDWQFKNGSPRYQVVDLDHGSVRTWAGTSADQQLRSFNTISDSGFNIATKTDKDEEIVLEESKKYAIYATYGGDGVYNSKLVDTVDSEEQAVDRVAELQSTGVGASYEEVETKNEVLNDSKLKKILTDYFKDDYIIEEKDGKIYTYQKGSNRKIFDIYNNWKELLDTTDLDIQNLEEECSQASGVASGTNGKIDSFPINPKEMEKQRLKESEDDIFNAREELINYLNQNTKYEWDANESYDNCAITESETDYIEVFVDIKDGNKIYTVDNYSYNSLEELVKNMPVLFTDEDEDYDYDSNWEDLDESKDLTKTLHEMALLEDYEDDISPQKQKFIEFCKDKIKDLGDIEIYDETAEENVQYHKIMHTEGIREFNDLYIVANFEEYDENLKAINSENKMVIDTPMIDCNGYAATMQFDEIDQEYYHTLLEYWNDLYMDEIIEEE